MRDAAARRRARRVSAPGLAPHRRTSPSASTSTHPSPPPSGRSTLPGLAQEGAGAGATLPEQAGRSDEPRHDALLKTGALQQAILDSENFSSIATDERGVIQVFNVGAQRMLGYAAAEVLNLITPADISDPGEVVQRALALSAEFGSTISPGFEALAFKASRGIEDIYELTYLRKDGSRLPAVVSVTALRDGPGRIIGYLLIGTDNTARKRADAEQMRLDQALLRTHGELQAALVAAERANQAKSDFLSSMSHELRSPLNAILGFAQLMESGHPAPTPTQLDSIQQILQAGWYLLELINEVLDLSLIESGKVSMSMEPIHLAEVLTDCLAMVAPQALKHGIVVSCSGPAAELCVRADRTRAKQVVVNLLTNAIKYNRPGGTVVVSCELRPAGAVRVTVQDTGQGLAAADLDRLFEPFNRLGQAQGREEGTGIGLVVSRRLVELMGGSIGVRSTVGEGSAFWIELQPDETVAAGASAQPAPLSLPAALDPALPRRTVLCVEDNPANLKLVASLLARRADLRLISAQDGRTGVELARRDRPDVILMDINLPGMSGVTALGLLAGDPATSHIPVVAVSANAMPRDVEKGLAAGFFRYLTKPIRLTAFETTLDEALDAAARRTGEIPR